ncbi:TetR family transcriptional regulator C-terminal domain-containing protein [Kineosporia rhizophila]|uniref:TetR/AcrR family transcriptional regulator n=1 Tax=Kineosporia TaxID=49184 RepID=UPI001E498CDB|nr:TetR family transcriptional regulator C-terminal domain-containing protein [Kineosporia sp. NBRC 101677]MCE0538214.1 TetR family transcriptional regulator C-terminal domain-containing protein [Kineosporia rhizophila]GLY15052.1 hypothetical protein Kisp01_20670 [Kineosporia sp. NBRC 101677]
MPRIVDHEERRRQIARAHRAQVAEHGFGATTYARTAAAAGVSVGTIQHYFADRSELVRFSFEALLTERDERVAAIVAAGEVSRLPIRAMVLTALHELLPVDEARRQEHSVGQQLRAEAWREPVLHQLALENDERLSARLRTAVENGKLCGEVPEQAAADVAVTRILATTYGLADQVGLLSGRGTPAYDEVLEPVIGTVFTGRCRHYDG